ncbi:hypothetical protein GCM10018787_50360 [Streptomyces thermodiastaticus]|nr:hypothetical protein GCM10018787_50360 [Streptomyces thermodiastaticus]
MDPPRSGGAPADAGSVPTLRQGRDRPTTKDGTRLPTDATARRPGDETHRRPKADRSTAEGGTPHSDEGGPAEDSRRHRPVTGGFVPALPQTGSMRHLCERIAHQGGYRHPPAERPSGPVHAGPIRISDVDMSLQRVADM